MDEDDGRGGKVEMENRQDVGEVESARGDVGGEEQRVGELSEAVEVLDALLLLHARVDAEDGELQPGQQRVDRLQDGWE